MPEVIPELIYVAAFLAALCAYLSARGLLFAWGHTLGALLQTLAHYVNFTFTLFGRTFGFDFGVYLQDANNAVITGLQNWADGAEIQMGYCLHGMTKVLQYTAEAIDYLASETAKTFEWTIRVKIPKFLKQFVTLGALGLIVGRMIQQAIHGITGHTLKTVHTITHAVTHDVTRVVRTVVHTSYALPGYVIHIPRELKGIERDVGRINLRVGKLWALLGVAGMAAAMANVFGIPNWRCLTRGNVGRTMRSLCGLPTKFLDDLLGILADIWILENVCILIGPLETAAADVGAPLVEALTAVGAGLCQGSIGAAHPLGGPDPVPPPYMYVSPLAA